MGDTTTGDEVVVGVIVAVSDGIAVEAGCRVGVLDGWVPNILTGVMMIGL